MLDIGRQFLYEHPLIVYCIINTVYYAITSIYRAKYYDTHLKKYRKTVELDKPANICLATLKITLLTSGIFAACIVFVIKMLTFGKLFLPNYKFMFRMLSISLYATSIAFIYFPLLLIVAILGIIGNYNAEDIELEIRR